MPIDEAEIADKLADHNARIKSNTKDISKLDKDSDMLREMLERRLPMIATGAMVAMSAVIGWLGNMVWMR